MEPKDREPSPQPPTEPSEKKKPRQTASANPISPDDLLGAPAQPESEGSWVPLAVAFVLGLVIGLIAGVLIGRG